jgi:AcrR family transcriptional regulator
VIDGMASENAQGYEVIWTRPERAGKGPAPSHSRAEITAAAIALADSEGIDAVSMRKVAAKLGAGTGTLYRYLSRKDDLLDLMIDAVEGEDGGPAPLSGDWRQDLRAFARRARSIIHRHPWVAVLAAGRPTLGPNGLRLAEHTLDSIAELRLTIDDMLVSLETLQAFVRGYTLGELAEQEAIRRSGLDRDQWMTAHAPYLQKIIADGQHPLVARVVLDAESPHADPRDERGFELGLERILDGLSANLPPTHA